MSNTAINVADLIQFSGQIAKANEVKCEKELMLHQLNLLKSFSELLKGSKNCEEFFQVEFQIQPGCDAGGDIISEFDVLLICIQNLSSVFTYDHRYWSILLQFSKGKVCVWNLKNPFKAGETEKFSTQFYPTFNTDGSPVEKVEIHLTFAMQLSGINYTKSFHIKTIFLDILYFLNPGRRPRSPHMLQQSIPSSLTTNDSSDMDNEQRLPSVCRFNLKTDDKLQKIFIREIFLKDTNFSRGFSMCSDHDSDVVLREPSEYYAYFYDDRIILSKEDNIISFRCSNPSVLYLLKDAIYRRLLTLCENRTVIIKSSDSKQCDSLYEVKLRLESLAKSTTTNVANYLGLYYEFREASESILCFCYNT